MKDPALWNVLLHGLCGVCDDVVNLCPCCRTMTTAFGLLTVPEQAAVVSSVLMDHLSGVPIARNVVVDGLLALALVKVETNLFPSSTSSHADAKHDDVPSPLQRKLHTFVLQAVLQLPLVSGAASLEEHCRAVLADLPAAAAAPRRHFTQFCLEALLCSMVGGLSRTVQRGIKNDSGAVFHRGLAGLYGAEYVFPPKPRLHQAERNRVDRLARLKCLGHGATLPLHADAMLNEDFRIHHGVVRRIGRSLTGLRGPLALLHKAGHTSEQDLALPTSPEDLAPASPAERSHVVEFWRSLSVDQQKPYLDVTRQQLTDAMPLFPMWLALRPFVRLHRAVDRLDCDSAPSDGWFHPCLRNARDDASLLTAVTDGSDVLFTCAGDVKDVSPFPPGASTAPTWMTGSFEEACRVLDPRGKCATCNTVRVFRDGLAWLVRQRIVVDARKAWSAAKAACAAELMAMQLLLEEGASAGKGGRSRRRRRQRKAAKKRVAASAGDDDKNEQGDDGASAAAKAESDEEAESGTKAAFLAAAVTASPARKVKAEPTHRTDVARDGDWVVCGRTSTPRSASGHLPPTHSTSGKGPAVAVRKGGRTCCQRVPMHRTRVPNAGAGHGSSASCAGRPLPRRSGPVTQTSRARATPRARMHTCCPTERTSWLSFPGRREPSRVQCTGQHVAATCAPSSRPSTAGGGLPAVGTPRRCACKHGPIGPPVPDCGGVRCVSTTDGGPFAWCSPFHMGH